jgi:hypothetical protein
MLEEKNYQIQLIFKNPGADASCLSYSIHLYSNSHIYENLSVPLLFD